MYRGRGREGCWGQGQKNLLTEENASACICNFPARERQIWMKMNLLSFHVQAKCKRICLVTTQGKTFIFMCFCFPQCKKH